MRNRLLEVLNEEYILSARARGLRERVVILKHALRNALIPLVTILGLHLPFLLGGSVLIESIFAWPGMGSLAVGAVRGRDYPLIMAISMMSAVLVIIGNLLADITYAALDPRVTYEKKRPV
jgi:peptide/nickel transport system permease protein